MTAKQIWLGVSVLAVIIAGFVVFSLMTSLTPKRVTITYNAVPDVSVKVYKVGSSEDLHNISSEKLAGEEVNSGVKSGEDIFLQRGPYVISVEGKNVQTKRYALAVTEDVKKDIKITYSRAYLDTLLKETEPTILASLKTALPTLESLYMVRTGKLYQNGDWYAARLRYIGKDPTIRDTLRVVLKKSGDGWELVTKSPEIIVTYPEYPTIPVEVVKDINSEEQVKIVPLGQ